MNYETPEVTMLAPAINVIQSISGKGLPPNRDSAGEKEQVSAYQDYEE